MQYAHTKETLITAPTVEPVSIAECARVCSICDHDSDDFIESLEVTARQHIESLCWSAFINQTWGYWFQSFDDRIFIPRPPFVSVSKFQYLDTSGTLQTVSSSVYEVGKQDGYSFVRLKYNQSWPTPRGYYDDVYLEVVCGYGATAASVPESIRHAIKLMVLQLFKRDDTSGDVSKTIDLLIQNHRFKGL